jgi:hypothetical protein
MMIENFSMLSLLVRLKKIYAQNRLSSVKVTGELIFDNKCHQQIRFLSLLEIDNNRTNILRRNVKMFIFSRFARQPVWKYPILTQSRPLIERVLEITIVIISKFLC